ncbi:MULTISPECIES: hypothetical protein [unclassified Iodidimonas]|jgi:hypothetical protein|uniref:hypothetical protein n=1 Tax=unclassified Iodidimonas TaxID=2626145 RepID=UPI00248296BA|nr:MULTISPECIES: hypothetical protein [unclassified Iodidimonas]
MKAFWPAIGLAVLGFVLLFIAAVMPPASGRFLVLFPSDQAPADRMQAVALAGGYVIDRAAIPGGWVIWSPDTSFQKKIRQHGATLVLDGAGWFGCGGRLGRGPFMLSDAENGAGVAIVAG